MQFAERVFKDVLALDVDGQVFAADASVGALQLGAEVTSLDVKVQHSGVIDEDCKWPVCQVGS